MAKYIVSDKTFTHPLYGNYKIVKVDNAHSITIRFCNTGYESKVEHSALYSNTVKDYEAPSVCGVGVLGHGMKGKTKFYKSAKSCWGDMLLRCYDKSSPYYRNYGGKGVTVCDEWLRFENFVPWYLKHHRKGLQIDKDLLAGEDGKIYSPNTCIFLPKKVNSYLRKPYKPTDLPQGVSVNCKNPAKFCAYILYASTGKRKNLGSSFKTPEAAFEVYRVAKMKDKHVVANIWYEQGLIDSNVRGLLQSFQITP